MTTPRGPNGFHSHLFEPPNLVDEDLFKFVLEHETHKAKRLRYCFSVLCIKPDGFDGAPALVTRIAELAIAQLRALDLAAVCGPTYVAVLLFDVDVKQLQPIVQRVTAALVPSNLSSVPADRITISAGGACYPTTAGNAPQLLTQAVELMERATKDGGNRLCVPG